MQKNTLFGPFLENGEKGYLLAGIVICELFGIALSPIIVPLNYISSFLMENIYILFDNIESYYNNRLLDSPDFNLCYCINLVYTDIQKDNTILYKIFRFINPYRYSLIMSILDYFHYYYSTPNYIFNLISKSPYMYYDYYIEKKYISLPQRRHACLLRYGVQTAENELTKIKNKIEKEEKNNNKKNKKIKNKKEKKNARIVKRSYENKNKNNDIDEEVDFGPSDSWESLKNICLQGKFGEYDYNFCFFGEFKQGDTLLGKFKKWGNEGNIIGQKNINEFDDDTVIDIGVSNEEEIEDEKQHDGGWFHFHGKKQIEKVDDEMQNVRSKYKYQIYEDGTMCQGNSIQYYLLFHIVLYISIILF